VLQSCGRTVGWLPSTNGRAYRPPLPSGQRQPRRQRGEFRTKDRCRRLTAGAGPRDRPERRLCPAGLPRRRRPAGDYVPCAEVAALALRVVSGYQVDQARITDVLAGLGELPAHPDVLLAVRLPAWRHWWQSRRTVGDRHLLGDHRFHGHLGDVGGVATGRTIFASACTAQPEEGPLAGPTLTLRRPDAGCRPTGTPSSQRPLPR